MVLRDLLILSYTALSSATLSATRFDDVLWDDDNWAIINRNLTQGDFRHRMTLSNGYLGINVAALGPFYEVEKVAPNHTEFNGWPLNNRRHTFASIAGFYGWQESINGSNYPWLDQYGGESVISGVPHWAGLYVGANGVVLNASVDRAHIHNFSSTLNITAGLRTWDYTWTPVDGEPIQVQYTMLVHKLFVNQAAVQLKLTASRDIDITVFDVLEGASAERTEFASKSYEPESPSIWTAVKPMNITDVTAFVHSTITLSKNLDKVSRSAVIEPHGLYTRNQSSIAQAFAFKLPAGKTIEVEKFVGAASSDAFDDPKRVAKDASISGSQQDFTALLTSHVEEWSSVLTRDSVDDFHLENGSLPNDNHIVEMQILAVTNPFYILQNTVGPHALAVANNTRLGVDSISVCGIGSDCYAGFIMWDADVWIAPGLQVSHPFHMQQVTRYRLEKFAQARENVKMAFTSSKSDEDFSNLGAVYPWTSGRQGNCTATGPCFDYEYHLNGDIAIAMYNELVVTGDGKYFKESLLPICNAIAHFYSELLSYNSATDTYYLENATDPDEYANNIDRPAFTTALIQMLLDYTNWLNTYFGLPANDFWAEQSSKMPLPIDTATNIILEYAKMPGSITVKQADVVLIDDLLHFHQPESLAALDYYAAKQSPFGPAMTYGAYSIVANELSPSGCSSYTYNLWSSHPYVRAPWFQFSEQLVDENPGNGGIQPAFPFLTGSGGANRVAIFGFLGLHLQLDTLEVDPSLPPQIPRLAYRTFYWQGYGIQAVSNQTHTTLTRLPKEHYTLPNANTTWAARPIPVSVTHLPHKRFSLDYDAPATMPNRQIGRRKTVPGNILQCASNVWSHAPVLPGQFPLSAIDGAASTKWQPVPESSAEEMAYLSIDLGEGEAEGRFYPVRDVMFDWGARPPFRYEVLFSNHSDFVPPFTSNLHDQGMTNGASERFTGMVVNVTERCPPPEISVPYDPRRAHLIQRYRGNTTNCTLEEAVWSGRYVHLGVVGSLYGGEWWEGRPSVAEFSLVVEEGWEGKGDEGSYWDGGDYGEESGKAGDEEDFWIQEL